MDAVTLEQAVETAMKLPEAQRQMLLDILRGRQIDARREEIARAAEEAREALHAGDLGLQSAEDAIAELRQALEEPD
jgi:hypothetical protein